MGAFGVAAFSCRQVISPYRGVQSHRLGRWSLLYLAQDTIIEKSVLSLLQLHCCLLLINIKDIFLKVSNNQLNYFSYESINF